MAELVTHYPVRLEQDLAWGEQDALGHVNNTVFFRFFENARVAHFLRVGIEFPKAGEAGQGPILASAHCDFLRPLTFPDRIRVEAGVSRIGSSSFTHSYRIFSFRQLDYVARGEAVIVYYDYAAARSQPLPERIRQALLELEATATGPGAEPGL